MAQSLSGLLILLVAAAAANAPFLTERLFGAVRLQAGKSAPLRFLELAVYYALTLGVAILIETRFGPRYPQRWEFYGITACLFMVLGYPGFVWRYLRGGAPFARRVMDDQADGAAAMVGPSTGAGAEAAGAKAVGAEPDRVGRP